VNGNDFTAFGSLLNSGIRAVRDFSANSAVKPLIILHEAQLQTASYWVQGISAAGVTDYDVLGLSHYYKWSTVNGMDSVRAMIARLKAQTGKKVMVVETAFSWTDANADGYTNIMSDPGPVAGFAVSRDGQYAYMKALTQAIISGGGSGLMYWEPAWISSSLSDRWGTGSSWENNTLFDFSGNSLPAIDFMRQPYTFPK
jgi:arabinogalactan endo-1,4-beta-galactosidase